MRSGWPRRRSPRLRGYDYAAPGAYFITVCAHNRELLFGRIATDRMAMYRLGEAVAACWANLPKHFEHAVLDAFVVMPNHVHGIVILSDAAIGASDAPTTVGAGFKPARQAPARRHGLSEIVRGFKTFSARRVNEIRGSSRTPVWQRGFYDRVIRREEELLQVREYIVNNTRRWAGDADDPGNWR